MGTKQRKIEQAVREWAKVTGIEVTAYWESPSHYAIGVDLQDGTTRAVRFKDLGLDESDSMLDED